MAFYPHTNTALLSKMTYYQRLPICKIWVNNEMRSARAKCSTLNIQLLAKKKKKKKSNVLHTQFTYPLRKEQKDHDVTQNAP